MAIAPGERTKIPSPVEVHIHLREPGGEESETIASGTHAAHNGGYQAVFDMPNNPGGNETYTEARALQKIDIAYRSAYTDAGFFSGVDFENPDFDAIPELVRTTVGPKYYMGFTTQNAKERTLDDVREYTDAYIEEALEHGYWSPVSLHARGEAGYETARYILEQGNPVRWCHIASTEEVRYVERLQTAFPGLFWAEVTPHHLTMTDRDADMKYGWNGGRMQPPLGGEADADALLDAYNKGVIAILATDHAPHPAKNKRAAERDNPTGINDTEHTTCYGVSGIEFVLPVMTALVARGKTTMDRVVDSLHTQPLDMLGFPENHAARRAETSLEFGPYVIGEADRSGASANTPYINWTAWAKVLSVKKRGREYPVKPLDSPPDPAGQAVVYRGNHLA
jgi:dihydroorotase